MSTFQDKLKQAELDPEYAYLKSDPRGMTAVWHKCFEPSVVHSSISGVQPRWRKENLPSAVYFLQQPLQSYGQRGIDVCRRGDFDQYGMVAAKDYFFDNKKPEQFFSHV